MTRLAALLESERAALLTGRYAALDPIRVEKEALLQALAARPGPAPALGPLAEDLARNARLIAAALAGLRDGQARAGALREAQRGFATYDRDGQRAATAAPAPRRRA